MIAIAGLFLFLFGFLLTLAESAAPELHPVTWPGFIGCVVLGFVCVGVGAVARK